MLKKFNKYMLENHPLTWHTKFVPLLVAGLVFWIISFISGYVMTDMEVLNSERISDYYADLFIVFHAIFALVIVSLWAFYFYRNNALRSFYPLQRFYLTKVFLQLFIAFSLLLAAYYPFTYGVYRKTDTLLNFRTIQFDAQQLNRTYPFLSMENSDYSLTQRSYPAPFPLEHMAWDIAKETWEGNAFYFDTVKIHQKYVSREQKKGMPSYYHAKEADTAQMIYVDGVLTLFFKATQKYEDADSCYADAFIDHFVDVSGVPNLHRFSVYNFSDLLIPDYGHILNTGKDIYSNQYAPAVHQQMDQGGASIQQSIEAFKKICRRYKITCNMNSRLLSRYLILKNYQPYYTLVSGYERDGWRYLEYNHPEEYAVLRAFEKGGESAAAYTDEDFFMAMERQSVYYFDRYALERVFSNFKLFEEGKYTPEVLIGIFIICFVLCWFFLLLEFTKIISLLISLPVGGLILILTGLIIGLVLDDLPNRKFTAMVLILFVAYTILGATILSLYVRILPRKLVDILINFGYCLAPLVIIIPFGFYIESQDNYVVNECGRDFSHYNDTLESPWLFLLFAFIGLFAYLPFIKRWKALEE